MKRCLVIVGASSYVLKSFQPVKSYDCLLISKRSEKAPELTINPSGSRIEYFNYDLTDTETNCQALINAVNPYDEIDVIFSSYLPTGTGLEDSIEDIALGLLANCIQPLYSLSSLSKSSPSKILNVVFISSIYAHVSPNPKNYIIDSEINPLYYGVAKAGVEQGLRWLSTVSTKHVFNAIALGPMPKPEVQAQSPGLIASLINSMPSSKLVEHKELHSTINFLLSQAQGSLRASTIHLDGGYGIW